METLQKLSRMMMRVDEHLLIETTIGPKVVMIEKGCRMLVAWVVENTPTAEGAMMEAATQQIAVREDITEIKNL